MWIVTTYLFLTSRIKVQLEGCLKRVAMDEVMDVVENARPLVLESLNERWGRGRSVIDGGKDTAFTNQNVLEQVGNVHENHRQVSLQQFYNRCPEYIFPSERNKHDRFSNESSAIVNVGHRNNCPFRNNLGPKVWHEIRRGNV